MIEKTIKEINITFKGILYKKEFENKWTFHTENLDKIENDLKQDFLKQLDKAYKNVDIMGFIISPIKKIYISEIDGGIYSDLEELNKKEKLHFKREEENKIYLEKQNAKMQEEKRLLSIKEKYLNLYLNTIKTDIQKGKIKKTLSNNIKSGDQIYTKYGWVQKIKEEGYKPKYEKMNKSTKNGNKEIWVYCAMVEEDKPFFELNKTEYDYLIFLGDILK